MSLNSDSCSRRGFSRRGPSCSPGRHCTCPGGLRSCSFSCTDRIRSRSGQWRVAVNFNCVFTSLYLCLSAYIYIYIYIYISFALGTQLGNNEEDDGDCVERA